MPTKIVVNLPTKDLKRAKSFYTALGYAMNPHFTDEDVACVVINDAIQVMVLVEPLFGRFTPREVADATTVTETVLTLSVDSREEVDDLVDKALAAGGSPVDQPETHDMHSRFFCDPDGHVWEIVWFDRAGFED